MGTHRMSKYYAGIGSRKTPDAILARMTALAAKLDGLGYTLRSGGAGGADTAFAEGATSKKVYLPWRGFAGLTFDFETYLPCASATAKDIASRYHPRWAYLNYGERSLHTRNVCQVLGDDMSTPAVFVVYWAPRNEVTNAVEGGTGQAIRIAEAYGIQTFHLGEVTDEEVLEYAVSQV